MERTEPTYSRSTVRPQFIYCCNDEGLLRANLLTGESGPAKKYLISSSSLTAVGLSCLEVCFSSLVDFTVTMHREEKTNQQVR
jgi:hypothetical protein